MEVRRYNHHIRSTNIVTLPNYNEKDSNKLVFPLKVYGLNNFNCVL